MTCPQRRLPTRFVMMAFTIVRASAPGLFFGLDEQVGISCSPQVKSLRHHFITVEGCTPYRRATFRMLQLLIFTSLTASRLTLGMCGFFVYAMYAILIQEVLPSY